MTEQQFTNTMNTFLKPPGDLLSRKLVLSQHLTDMPGALDGQYVVKQFEISFAHKKSATETVTFRLEKDGQWNAAGYFMKYNTRVTADLFMEFNAPMGGQVRFLTFGTLVLSPDSPEAFINYFNRKNLPK